MSTIKLELIQSFNEDHRYPRCGSELRTKAHLAEQLMDPNRTYPIALQLWTIRDAMALDADLALGRAKAAGFTAVELAPLPPGLTPVVPGTPYSTEGSRHAVHVQSRILQSRKPKGNKTLRPQTRSDPGVSLLEVSSEQLSGSFQS